MDLHYLEGTNMRPFGPSTQPSHDCEYPVSTRNYPCMPNIISQPIL